MIWFSKQATLLPTYLFLKPTQGGFSQLSCFIAFFSQGLTHRDKTYRQLSCWWTFTTCGCTLARLAGTHARLHVRTTNTYTHSHTRKLPKGGNSVQIYTICAKWVSTSTPNSINGDFNRRANQKATSGTGICSMYWKRRSWFIVEIKLCVWCVEQVNVYLVSMKQKLAISQKLIRWQKFDKGKHEINGYWRLLRI